MMPLWHHEVSQFLPLVNLISRIAVMLVLVVTVVVIAAVIIGVVVVTVVVMVAVGGACLSHILRVFFVALRCLQH
jgi:hypothetical protein